MSQVSRNVVANFAGQLWSALMGVIFIPVYIHLLGLESFALIGFFVTLQALAVVFDVGLAGTINRELARRGMSDAQATRDLVRTLEWIYWPLGILVAVLIWSCSGLLARFWLHPVALEPSRVALAVALMGATVGAQWPTAYYAAGLNGLQRQVLSNVLTAVFGTLRGAGVLMPLVLLAPTIEVFFIWQTAVGAIQTVVSAWALWRVLPPGTRATRFSSSELARVGGFTFGLTAIALLSFALVQVDRIILSRLLPLDQFGVYTLAASVAVALLRLVQPWFNAIYPRFSELHGRGEDRALRSLYHASSQWLAATVLPAAAVIAVFAQDLLRLWTRDPGLASAAAPLLAVLVCGTALNGLMHMPYAMQLAHGWPRLALWTNVASVFLAVPGIWWLTDAFGPIGAASVWLILNLAYVFIALPLMNRRIMQGELAVWYLQDVGPPAAVSLVASLTLRVLFPSLPDGVTGIAILAGVFISVAIAAFAAARGPRDLVLGSMANLMTRA